MILVEKFCWKCRERVDAEWICCPYCATQLRDTRVSVSPETGRDFHFLMDLYSFGWYNRDLASLALYESIATIEDYYNPERLDRHKPLVTIGHAQKILRLKIFAEHIALLEAFGYLCIAIKERREKSIPWTYLNTSPQKVVEFYNQVLSTPKLSLIKLLKLPSLSQIKKAIENHPEVNLPGIEAIGDANGIYEPLIKNLRICAKVYRDNADLNVRAYNRVKHVFPIIEGEGWIEFEKKPEVTHSVFLLDLEEEAAKVFAIDVSQDKTDKQMEDIRQLTQMGSEILAICIALNKLGILF